MLALAVACSSARLEDARSHAVRGLVGAMVLYSAGIASVLAYAGAGMPLPGIGPWPTVALHVAMTFWCLMRRPNGPQNLQVAAGEPRS